MIINGSHRDFESFSFYSFLLFMVYNIHLTKTANAQNEVALSYHRVCGLYFLEVVFVTNIVNLIAHVVCLDYCAFYLFVHEKLY